MKMGGWLRHSLRHAPARCVENDEARPLRERLRSVLPLLVAAAFFAALAAIGAALVTLKLRELEAGHALGELHRARVAAQSEQRRLDLELGTLRRPDRVLPIARDKLHLAPPLQTQNGAVPQ